MSRKFVVGGNWKMNGTKAEIDKIIDFLKAGPLNPETEVIVGVPAIYLDYVMVNKPTNVAVAAQNCYKVPKGAFTGKLAYVISSNQFFSIRFYERIFREKKILWCHSTILHNTLGNLFENANLFIGTINFFFGLRK